MAGIKEDPWFKQDYTPADPDDEEDDVYIDDDAFSIHELVYTRANRRSVLQYRRLSAPSLTNRQLSSTFLSFFLL